MARLGGHAPCQRTRRLRAVNGAGHGLARRISSKRDHGDPAVSVGGRGAGRSDLVGRGVRRWIPPGLARSVERLKAADHRRQRRA